ncbi:hypothetical protein [Chroococcidiopsis sp.]|uniref:hypothetical protein n=1 Tax=Chroococcidiopsis sp. TaxID=3088168 RepID=UPI003F3B07F8
MTSDQRSVKTVVMTNHSHFHTSHTLHPTPFLHQLPTTNYQLPQFNLSYALLMTR